MDTLKGHRFVSKVLDDGVAVQKSAGIDPLSEVEDSPLLNELQFYITRVGFGLAHTLTWLEQLHYAISFSPTLVIRASYGKAVSIAHIT
jgi:hypothetical protein